MSNFICQTLEYLPTHQCEVDVDGNIVAQPGYEFKELFSGETMEFTESQNEEKGNIFFEQSVTVLYKYDDPGELIEIGAPLILKLGKLDDSSRTWGSLNPFNPVLAFIDIINGIAEIRFFRNSIYPEF